MRYFGACEAILKMGPFKTEVEAWEHLELSVEERERRRRNGLPDSIHMPGARVWPERPRRPAEARP